MLKTLPSQVHVVEVGPRDGLQNEPVPIATNYKCEFICKLAEAGLKTIELTGFVRREAVPQLADAPELVAMVHEYGFSDYVNMPCLVPNMKGIETAVHAGVEEVAIFTATSDGFSQRNINASVEESYERLALVTAYAKEHNIRVRGYLSTIFACPYDGKTAIDRVVEGTKRLLEMGCYEVSLGDTIGIGTPKDTVSVLEALFAANVQPEQIALHFHDTRGLALANITVALEMGITTFDASAGGLGGCPYAEGSTGNVATEDVVYLCEEMGIDTGVNLDELVAASSFMLEKLGRTSPSKIHHLVRTR